MKPRSLALLLLVGIAVLLPACGTPSKGPGTPEGYSGSYVFWIYESTPRARAIEVAAIAQDPMLLPAQLHDFLSRQIVTNNVLYDAVPPPRWRQRQAFVRSALAIHTPRLETLRARAEVEDPALLIMQLNREMKALFKQVTACYAESPACHELASAR